MPEDSPIDLAKLDAWCGVRPGMTRAQVLETLQQQGVEAEEYGSDNLTATTDAWEMQFYFATDDSRRLRQLSIEEGEILWGGQRLVGVRLDEALRLLGSPATAVWQANDVIHEPFPEPGDAPIAPVTDEELLEEGTVWLPERGLGLVIGEGEVIGVAWRAPQDLPTQFAGPVTNAQRELSTRPDLESHLDAKRAARFKAEEKKDPLSSLRTLLTVATIAALAFVAKKGFEEMQLWNKAPTLTAKFVAIENVPMKQFRDFLPPELRWLFPRLKPVIVEAYRVEFTAPREELPQQATLEQGELYVPPREAGDEVPVVYLSGNPPRVKGLARARDSAFVDYMPWAIAIGAIWLLAQFALGLLPAALSVVPRIVRRLAPKSVVKDVDRPELR
jgi:hypothetical protein